MTTWVNVRTGERVQSEASPGAGWVTLAEAKVRHPDAYGAGEPEKGYKPNANDPYDPTYGSADARVTLLDSAGFQWQSGEGPNALWITPDGRLVPELTALKMAADATPSARPGTGSNLTFDEQMRLRSTPSVSYSYSPPDELDWAKEDREAANDEATRKRYIDEGAREDVKLRVLIEKERVATEAGQRAEAREIARDIENAQYRRDQAAARVDEINQAAINRAQEFNAQSAADAADRTERARETNIAAKRQNAVDIAGFQQMPGDIARLGAYLQARQGEGGSPISTAVGQGENFITDQSLTPLQELLNVQASQSNAPIFSGARLTPALLAQQQTANPDGLAAALARLRGMQPSPEFPVGDGSAGMAGGVSPLTRPGTPDWVTGGQRETATQAMTQESAPALFDRNAPFGRDEQGNPISQIGGDWTGVDRMPDPTTPTPTPANARIFQREAAAKSRTRSGLLGDLTPVRFADPGTDPYLAELAGGVTAAERGVDQRLFERERQRLTPRGYGTRVFGRSR